MIPETKIISESMWEFLKTMPINTCGFEVKPEKYQDPLMKKQREEDEYYDKMAWQFYNCGIIRSYDEARDVVFWTIQIPVIVEKGKKAWEELRNQPKIDMKKFEEWRRNHEV